MFDQNSILVTGIDRDIFTAGSLHSNIATRTVVPEHYWCCEIMRKLQVSGVFLFSTILSGQFFMRSLSEIYQISVAFTFIQMETPRGVLLKLCPFCWKGFCGLE